MCDAIIWHHGRRQLAWKAKWKDGEVQHAKAVHLIAHRPFRYASPGRTFAIPQYEVTIVQEGQPADRIFEAAVKILADRVHDLVMRVEIAPLREQLGPDRGYASVPPGQASTSFPPLRSMSRCPIHSLLRRSGLSSA